MPLLQLSSSCCAAVTIQCKTKPLVSMPVITMADKNEDEVMKHQNYLSDFAILGIRNVMFCVIGPTGSPLEQWGHPVGIVISSCTHGGMHAEGIDSRTTRI